MEYRDLYDKDRNLTGKIIAKGEEIPNGYYIRVVVCFMENSEGKFLMQKRSELKDGKWGTTGGHPKSGEDSLTGMHTEILEELGLDINKEELKLVTTEQDNKIICDIYHLKKDIDLNDIIMQESEVADVKYLTLEEIEDLYEKGEFKKSHYYMFHDFQKNLNQKQLQKQK